MGIVFSIETIGASLLLFLVGGTTFGLGLAIYFRDFANVQCENNVSSNSDLKKCQKEVKRGKAFTIALIVTGGILILMSIAGALSVISKRLKSS